MASEAMQKKAKSVYSQEMKAEKEKKLLKAALLGDTEEVQRLLSMGVSPNYVDKCGRTAVHTRRSTAISLVARSTSVKLCRDPEKRKSSSRFLLASYCSRMPIAPFHDAELADLQTFGLLSIHPCNHGPSRWIGINCL